MPKIYNLFYNLLFKKDIKNTAHTPKPKLTSIPDKIPIMRMEDYHTHYLGKNSDGILFWGYETFAYAKHLSELTHGGDWKSYRKEYVLLHTFNPNGTYIATQHWFAGITAECSSEIMAEKLANMVDTLGDAEYCDIEIYLFQTVIDGIIFGLVADVDSRTIVLQPSSTISFKEPWDGEYYT